VSAAKQDYTFSPIVYKDITALYVTMKEVLPMGVVQSF
jgi:hypothetical protein